MVRSALGKVAWVGRTASMVFGLALVMALVVGVASAAFGANGQAWILGQLNKATSTTKLNGNAPGKAALVVNNFRTEAGSKGLQLNVDAGKAPLAVNPNAGKATNLDADKLDGQDSSSFASTSHNHDGSYYAAGSKVADSSHADQANSAANSDRLDNKDSSEFAAGTNGKANNAELLDGRDSSAFLATGSTATNADRLDGLDSTALGVTTLHNKQQIATCDTPPTDPKTGNTFLKQACAPLQVVVPPGKRYLVSVWSSFTVYDSSNATLGSFQWLRYCSAMKAPGQAEPSCITPFGIRNLVRITQGEGSISASSSGETHALTEGTYIFGTVVQSERDLTNPNDPYTNVITKIMVRDASAPQPTGVSIP